MLNLGFWVGISASEKAEGCLCVCWQGNLAGTSLTWKRGTPNKG